MPETITETVKEITPNTRVTIQIVGFFAILGSVWAAGWGGSTAVNAARNQAAQDKREITAKSEEDKREITAQIQGLREELNRGQAELKFQLGGAWTTADQRRWSKLLERSNPTLVVPDPDEVRAGH